MARKRGTTAARGEIKLSCALRALGVDVRGRRCADFGCSVGGFTRCLLREGAACVYAIDAGYGLLAWSLRQDERVVVMERTNVLDAPAPAGGVDVVTVDVGWTPQRHVVPAALRWVARDGWIVTLIKPQYEAPAPGRGEAEMVLSDEAAFGRAMRAVRALEGVRVMGWVRSPIRGQGGRRRAGPRRRRGGGNAEWFALLRPR